MKSESLIFVIGIVFLAFLIINNFTKNLEEKFDKPKAENTIVNNVETTSNTFDEDTVVSNIVGNNIDNTVDITAIEEIRNMKN